MNSQQQEAIDAFEPMRTAIEGERFIYGVGEEVRPGQDCWDWLQGFVLTIYQVIKTGWVQGRVRVLITYDEPGGNRQRGSGE